MADARTCETGPILALRCANSWRRIAQAAKYYAVAHNICMFSMWNFLNPLNAELNPICYLLALLGAHHFLHVSRIRVNVTPQVKKVKVKVTLVQALRLCTGRTAHRVSRGIALLFHDQRH